MMADVEDAEPKLGAALARGMWNWNGPDGGDVGGGSSAIDVDDMGGGADAGGMFSLPFEGCFEQRVLDSIMRKCVSV